MQFDSTEGPLREAAAGCLALGVFEGRVDVPQGAPAAEALAAALAAGELSGKLGDVTPILGVPGLTDRALFVFGLGRPDDFNPGKAFAAGVALTKHLRGKARPTVAVALPEAANDGPKASAFVEGLVVGAVGPGLRKSDSINQNIGSLRVVVPEALAAISGAHEAVRRGLVVGEAVNLARELVNTPPAEKRPAVLAERAREAAEGAGLTVEVWDEVKIRDERFGGLIGVSAGSDEPPRFVVLEHLKGGGSPVTALIGKGITFDSGGLSLKPSASMEDMKCDMAGAAAVIGALVAVARLGLPINVRGYLAISENMTGGRAMKLGDVLAMRNGKTVEVMNTDAEGRLVLADALSYAAEAKPSRMVDLATLTGACMVALGTKVAGLFSNDDALAAEVQSACESTGERSWRMPLDADYRDGLKSHVADIKNVAGKWGGAITASKFLEQFVGDVPWAHLDIAGPSWADGDSATRDIGGTGAFVRTLVSFLRAHSETDAS